MMDAIVNFITDFNPSALLPDLDSMLGKVETLLRLAVLAGPVVLLVLGLLYFLLPPKEANHSFGYRFFWGMSSQDSWRFTQKVAGVAWGLLGLVLTVVMLLVCAEFRGMETMDMVWSAVRCILWEIGTLAVSCVIIDGVVITFYDSKGDLRPFARRDKKKKAPKREAPKREPPKKK